MFAPLEFLWIPSAMAGLKTVKLSELDYRLEAILMLLAVLLFLGLIAAVALVITSRRLANVSLSCCVLS